MIDIKVLGQGKNAEVKCEGELVDILTELVSGVSAAIKGISKNTGEDARFMTMAVVKGIVNAMGYDE